jgi:small-conductance mechanosensitive channel/CRP-like cAMP-binding protein
MQADWTAPLFAGLAITVLVARVFAPKVHSRARTISFLLVLQVGFVIAAAWLQREQSRSLNDVRLAALIVGALAAIGMVSSMVGSISAGGRLPIPTIVRDVGAAIAGLVSVFLIAARMGIDLSGVIATSAVVTAVIGFSLQDTLGNVIGGLALEMDSSIRIGDWVRIGDIAGQVREIRWRYTAIETRNWETIIVPNSIMMKSQVMVEGRRTGKPLQRRRWIWFNIDFRHAPSDVIAVVNEALRDCHIDNVAMEPAPNCILMDLHESFGKYAVRYWLTNLAVDDPTDSQVRTRIYFALKRAGIPLSIPAVAAFVTEESTERKLEKEHSEHDRRLKALTGIELFNTLPEDVRENLAASLKPAPFAMGEVMTRQGAEAHWLYLIVHGEVSVRVAANGNPPKEVSRLQDGHFFGEMSLLTGAPRNATLIALSNVDCYRLDRPAAQAVLKERPDFAEKLAEKLAERQLQIHQFELAGDQDSRDRQLRDTKTDLLERIRDFFGLDDEEEAAVSVG